MKKIILFLSVVIIFISSCTREIPLHNQYGNTASNASPIPGNFTLTKFTNLTSNADSTAAFDGYVFSFDDDGKVSAVKDNQTTLGSYTITHTLNDNLELIFYFNNNPLTYLNGNWWVKSISDASIQLADASTADVVEFTGQ